MREADRLLAEITRAEKEGDGFADRVTHLREIGDSKREEFDPHGHEPGWSIDNLEDAREGAREDASQLRGQLLDLIRTTGQLPTGWPRDVVVAGGTENGWTWRVGLEQGEATGVCGWCSGAFSTGAQAVHAMDPDGERYSVHPGHWVAFRRAFVLGYVRVELSPDAAAVAAGLVAPNDVVNSQGIHAGDVIGELQEVFPVAQFHCWAARHDLNRDGVGYLPEAGE
ncbi:MAG: hypothetical protein ACRDRL_25020 [Sciscionella sp.]